MNAHFWSYLVGAAGTVILSFAFGYTLNWIHNLLKPPRGTTAPPKSVTIESPRGGSVTITR